MPPLVRALASVPHETLVGDARVQRAYLGA